MKLLKITSVWLLLTLPLPAKPQESPQKKPSQQLLGLGIGFQNRLLLDEQKSALAYNSTEYLARFFYNSRKERSILSVDLTMGTGSYTSSHAGERWIIDRTYNLDGSITIDSMLIASGILTGLLEISYLKKAGQGTQLRWFAGPALKDLMVFPENNIGLLNSLGLYALLSAEKNIGEGFFLGTVLSLPIVALNSRLPWHNTTTDPIKSETATFFKKGTRLVSLKHFQLVQFKLNGNYQIAPRWNIGAEYAFCWLRVSYYQPMKSAVHTILFKTAYTF